MSLAQLIKHTIDCERKMIVVYLANTILLILIFHMMMNTVSILYPLSVSMFLLIIYLCISAFNLYQLQEKLVDSLACPNDRSTYVDYREDEIFKSINSIHHHYLDIIYAQNVALNERNSLFSRWIHNLKTSVTVIGLATEKEQVSVSDIRLENQKLRNNLEECLNVLRLDVFSNDYVPESLNLSELVQLAINNQKRDFIYAGVFPQVNFEGVIVYTDKKWCIYLLEQLISNAIKYSVHKKNKQVYFEVERSENNATLLVRDQGRGIDPVDLPRVFELFYTGKNGRENLQATGIGLYMVKHIAKMLGHDVHISSTLNQGTTVSIQFLSKL